MDRARARTTTADRILGCLKGIATGDAIGKQTETLSREDVLRWYPQGIRGFEGTPGAIIPRYVGNSKREWRIGETTDDTERTVAVARAIIAERNVSHASIGREMLRCTKSVHPGVRSLWEFHQAADPARIATAHDGCGAAIRVAPVGIFYTSDRLDELVTGAREASISTHGGSLAIAAAAATAAAVSAAIDAASPLKFWNSPSARRRKPRAGGRAAPPLDSRTRFAASTTLRSLPVIRTGSRGRALLSESTPDDRAVGAGPRHVMQSAEDAILLAANIGGDSDSVASIAGGILGAMYPDTVNQQWHEVVERINSHDLVAIANELAGSGTDGCKPAAFAAAGGWCDHQPAPLRLTR